MSAPLFYKGGTTLPLSLKLRSLRVEGVLLLVKISLLLRIERKISTLEVKELLVRALLN